MREIRTRPTEPVTKIPPRCVRALWAYFDNHGNIKMAGQSRAHLPRCNARTRAGGFCKRSISGVPGKSRCVMHGGHPRSGQRTPEGIRRSAEGVRRYFAARRAPKAASAAASTASPAATKRPGAECRAARGLGLIFGADAEGPVRFLGVAEFQGRFRGSQGLPRIGALRDRARDGHGVIRLTSRPFLPPRPSAAFMPAASDAPRFTPSPPHRVSW